MPFSGIKACLFDAHGTLFDLSAIAEAERPALGQCTALLDLP